MFNVLPATSTATELELMFLAFTSTYFVVSYLMLRNRQHRRRLMIEEHRNGILAITARWAVKRSWYSFYTALLLWVIGLLRAITYPPPTPPSVQGLAFALLLYTSMIVLQLAYAYSNSCELRDIEQYKLAEEEEAAKNTSTNEDLPLVT